MSMGSSIYDDKPNRDKATLRALKMLKLFEMKNWRDIMKIVEKAPQNPTPPADFVTACDAAGLVPEEIVWLWLYLQVKPAYETLPDAAPTGW